MLASALFVQMGRLPQEVIDAMRGWVARINNVIDTPPELWLVPAGPKGNGNAKFRIGRNVENYLSSRVG